VLIVGGPGGQVLHGQGGATEGFSGAFGVGRGCILRSPAMKVPRPVVRGLAGLVFSANVAVLAARPRYRSSQWRAGRIASEWDSPRSIGDSSLREGGLADVCAV